jgi:manganese peroxidase
VPIVQKIQNDLFDGGECGDAVLILISISNFTLLTFLAMQALSALRLVFHDAMGFSIHGVSA